MPLFRWILLLLGVLVIAGVFAYSRGWFRLKRAPADTASRAPKREPVLDAATAEPDEPRGPEIEPEPAEPVAKEPEIPSLSQDSMVVAVRIMPAAGAKFPAEKLILALRGAGLQHGKFGIFHCLDSAAAERVRYSVASLVEPGSFDLSRLKESSYEGISVFTVLPAPEDGVDLFDEMLVTARTVAKEMGGCLVDEQGGALSVQREMYMREEVMEFLRRHQQTVSQAV